MKRFAAVFGLLVGGLAWATSNQWSSGGDGTGFYPIEQIWAKSLDNYGYVWVSTNVVFGSDNANCHGYSPSGSLGKIDLTDTYGVGKEMYRTALAAKLAGKRVQFLVDTDACSGGTFVIKSVVLK